MTQGGGVAAPVGGQILSEVLPYLEVNKTLDESEIIEEIQMPDVLGKSLEEAEKILKEYELEVVYESDSEEIDKTNTYIKEQTPKAGITINKGSKIYLK